MTAKTISDKETISSLNKFFQRGDSRALFFGILISFGFTAVIWLAGARLASVPHIPDQGASWYYWKLAEPTVWSRATAWGFYFLHQVTIWGLIYYSQTRVKKYTTGLHPINYLALGLNALFIGIHFVQTHLWYDGLAQDVSIWSSQASVAVLLIWVLLMENNRRGLFFGKRVPIRKEIIRMARKYHGYFFAWAIVYTFWYHPMEPTSGHLIGFFYMFLLMLQGSLFFTRIHINRTWTLFQEVLVLAHGTLVAIGQGNDLWPMFAFGFGGIFVITQMHGLNLSRLARGALLAFYILAVIWAYSSRGWVRINEIIRIPIIDYLAVFLLTGIIALVLWIVSKFQTKTRKSLELG